MKIKHREKKNRERRGESDDFLACSRERAWPKWKRSQIPSAQTRTGRSGTGLLLLLSLLAVEEALFMVEILEFRKKKKTEFYFFCLIIIWITAFLRSQRKGLPIQQPSLRASIPSNMRFFRFYFCSTMIFFFFLSFCISVCHVSYVTLQKKKKKKFSNFLIKKLIGPYSRKKLLLFKHDNTRYINDINTNMIKK